MSSRSDDKDRKHESASDKSEPPSAQKKYEPAPPEQPSDDPSKHSGEYTHEVTLTLIEEKDVDQEREDGRHRIVRGHYPLPAGESLEDSIRKFLKDNYETLKVKSDPASLGLIYEVPIPTGRVFRFQQMHENVPILDCTLLVHLDRANFAVLVYLGTVDDKVVNPPDGHKKISAVASQKIAWNAIRGARIRRKLKPEPVYFPTRQGLRLAYLVKQPVGRPAHDYQFVVDAYSSTILDQRDLIQEFPDGEGYVFDPNPAMRSPSQSLKYPDATLANCGFEGSRWDEIDALREVKTLKDLRTRLWRFRLDGPYARARRLVPWSLSLPAEIDPNNFKYSSSDHRFEAVNVYYHLDTFQRYLQKDLKIFTANNRQTLYDPHFPESRVAFYSPIFKTLHFSKRHCHPDKAEDAYCIVHEYGHAIQDNQVPGWGAANPDTGRRETLAMGEGFGDAVACIYFAPQLGQVPRNMLAAFENWACGSEEGGCLRRVDCDKKYPEDWTDEVHRNGEIWSGALWEIFKRLGHNIAARDELLKAVIGSHHRLLLDSTMRAGASAVLDEHAALDDSRGRNLIHMLNVFHERGMLRSVNGVDLRIGHSGGDNGIDTHDLWIRNNDDGIAIHEEPKAGQSNWFYARVTNHGNADARAFVVTFYVQDWKATPFTYPGDFTEPVSAAAGHTLVSAATRTLAVGQSEIVSVKWPANIKLIRGKRLSVLASVYSPMDPPKGANVIQDNNLAQKEVRVQ